MSDATPGPSETAGPPSLGTRIGGAFKSVVGWFKGKDVDAEKELADVRAHTPAPVLWLFGRTQSGKSSLIRHLTGATDAEIGNGFRPCTRFSRMYPFPTEDAPVFTFLDTRGVDEPGYDPAEDLKQFDGQAHLMLVTCRLRDFATGSMREALRTIRAANPRRPVVLVLTCLHEAYPQTQHPQPYPYADLARTPVVQLTPPADPPAPTDAVWNLVLTQKEHYAGLVDRIVPIDITQPEEGYDDPNYGGEALKRVILDLLPEAYRETLKQFTDAAAQLTRLHDKRTAPILVGYSTLAGTAGALPIPFVDLLLIGGIQTKMIHALAETSGQKDNAKRFLEVATSAGIGLLATAALRQLAKFIPYVGSVVGAGLAAASTYALGRAYLEYDRRVHEGHIPDRDEVAKLYKEQFSAAEQRWGKKESTPGEPRQ
jgi:uncharacterized protein (DUF697 family)